ncbi:hypothetical protein DBR39_01395 [Chryseobacterium sp. KBW03]|jgi:hypothetical protein|uniref:hypothetical protein n=1 Tax=Chryseobacterium sp. KBW03 TaxID=2153362 RepID=UPI000F5A4256|nr:hypothetical protein [Chryseobacterium sp. KBW03]RQO42560.1 hypothetical protein DBR39_01395 [Chryseobacterium sp. KBW03]
MKKNLIFFIHVLFSLPIYSQVGINTATPLATLDVTGNPSSPSITDGIIAPRITLAELTIKNSAYGTSQNGTIIYVTTINGTPLGDTQDINTPGYYYHDGTKWNSIGKNIYTADGTLTGNRAVTMSANTLAFTGSATNAFSIDGTTLSVDASNNRTGFGTATPNNTVEINSGTASASGLRLSQINNATAPSPGQPIGVNANGDIVTVNFPVGTELVSVATTDKPTGDDTNYTNSQLSINVPIGKYSLETFLIYTSGGLNDIKVKLLLNSGTMQGSGYWLAPNNGNSNTDETDIDMTLHDFFSYDFIGGGDGVSQLVLTLKGFLNVTAAGTITLQFGNNGNVILQPDAILRQNSWLKLTKLN